ncbi:hypothetical protein [Aquabacter cavernae]|uniref:hypothetical protein n=1 Tax=Aquabacter cavernae TaxID=2496029 RepID=UPI000F8F23FB|nr:hypothetical protein [Aquabacter cavernae]
MHDFFIALISFFIVDPLDQALREQLSRAAISEQRMAQVTSCLQAETPAILDKAAGDPVWVIVTAAKVWTGMVTPQTALNEIAPSCSTAAVI